MFIATLLTFVWVRLVAVLAIESLLPSAIPLFAGTGIAMVVLMMSVIYHREGETEDDAARLPGMRQGERMRGPRVLIIGAGTVGQTLAGSLEEQMGCEVVGFVDDERYGMPCGRWPILGSRDAVRSIIRERGVEEVVVAYAPTWQQRLVEDLMTYEDEIAVRVVPSTYEALMRTARVENLGDVAVVRLAEPDGRIWDAAKRMLDGLAAAVVLIASSPVFVIASGLIKLTSPGPVIFAQQRIGRYGRPFTLIKFRTMVPDAEADTGPVLSDGKHDPRVTPVGRWFRAFRIDELPQLWNVLRGDMSLVGPRPERPVFVEEFERTAPLYPLRHEVRPGITGLAQVCGGYKTDARDKLRFDLIYVSHRSLWLDVKILLKTVAVVFSSKGS